MCVKWGTLDNIQSYDKIIQTCILNKQTHDSLKRTHTVGTTHTLPTHSVLSVAWWACKSSFHSPSTNNRPQTKRNQKKATTSTKQNLFNVYVFMHNKNNLNYRVDIEPLSIFGCNKNEQRLFRLISGRKKNLEYNS